MQRGKSFVLDAARDTLASGSASWGQYGTALMDNGKTNNSSSRKILYLCLSAMVTVGIMGYLFTRVSLAEV